MENIVNLITIDKNKSLLLKIFYYFIIFCLVLLIALAPCIDVYAGVASAMTFATIADGIATSLGISAASVACAIPIIVACVVAIGGVAFVTSNYGQDVIQKVIEYSKTKMATAILTATAISYLAEQGIDYVSMTVYDLMVKLGTTVKSKIAMCGAMFGCLVNFIKDYFALADTTQAFFDNVTMSGSQIICGDYLAYCQVSVAPEFTRAWLSSCGNYGVYCVNSVAVNEILKYGTLSQCTWQTVRTGQNAFSYSLALGDVELSLNKTLNGYTSYITMFSPLVNSLTKELYFTFMDTCASVTMSIFGTQNIPVYLNGIQLLYDSAKQIVYGVNSVGQQLQYSITDSTHFNNNNFSSLANFLYYLYVVGGSLVINELTATGVGSVVSNTVIGGTVADVPISAGSVTRVPSLDWTDSIPATREGTVSIPTTGSISADGELDIPLNPATDISIDTPTDIADTIDYYFDPSSPYLPDVVWSPSSIINDKIGVFDGVSNYFNQFNVTGIGFDWTFPVTVGAITKNIHIGDSWYQSYRLQIKQFLSILFWCMALLVIIKGWLSVFNIGLSHSVSMNADTGGAYSPSDGKMTRGD